MKKRERSFAIVMVFFLVMQMFTMAFSLIIGNAAPMDGYVVYQESATHDGTTVEYRKLTELLNLVNVYQT